MASSGSGRRHGPHGGAFLVAVVIALLAPALASAAGPPTLPPFTPGRHVYDNGKLMSAKGIARAEELAASIESLGGGRVVVYTGDSMTSSIGDAIVTSWNVDGLLLTAYDPMGDAMLGPTLRSRLDQEAVKVVDSSPGPQTPESWIVSTLARTEARLRGVWVFDGYGLDATTRSDVEAAAKRLSDSLGSRVVVDIAMAKPGTGSGDADTAAFFNGADLETDFDRSLVIALGVSPAGEIGGYLDADSGLWDAYESSGRWSSSTMNTHGVADVNAAILGAVTSVHKTPSPTEAMLDFGGSIGNSISGFFADPTNRAWSLAGFLVAFLLLLLLRLDRARRRREAGYGGDDSVLAAGPPDGMTPALASLVTSPLDSTRAVTTALLDLAAHGSVAFYEEMTPFGPRGGIRVLTAATATEPAEAAAPAPVRHTSRPPGPVEKELLAGLEEEATLRASSYIPPSAFAGLRPLFDRTAERLHEIATEHGWLTLQTRASSVAWQVVALGELVAAAFAAYRSQPVAAVCLFVGALMVNGRARHMPLPLRTRDGTMTVAMLEAYRRTLRRILAAPHETLPAWLDSAEDATLWGYAWGLEGDVQTFVSKAVRGAMETREASENAELAMLALDFAAAGAPLPTRPVGLDTDAISSALDGLGRPLAPSPPPAAVVPTDPAPPAALER